MLTESNFNDMGRRFGFAVVLCIALVGYPSSTVNAAAVILSEEHSVSGFAGTDTYSILGSSIPVSGSASGGIVAAASSSAGNFSVRASTIELASGPGASAFAESKYQFSFSGASPFNAHFTGSTNGMGFANEARFSVVDLTAGNIVDSWTSPNGQPTDSFDFQRQWSLVNGHLYELTLIAESDSIDFGPIAELTVEADFTVIPLPAAAWMGLSMLGGFCVRHLIRHRRLV